MNEYELLKRAQKKYESKLQVKLNAVLDDLKNKDVENEGLTLKKIAQLVTEKTYATTKEEHLIYRLIVFYRKVMNPCLICRKQKYGFPQTKEQVESYANDQVSSAVGRLVNAKKGIDSNSSRLSLGLDSRKLIEDKFDELFN